MQKAFFGNGPFYVETFYIKTFSLWLLTLGLLMFDLCSLTFFFFHLCSHSALLYLCFDPQMALLGFYHDSSLFTSKWKVFMLEHITTGIVCVCVCVRERERERERMCWGTPGDRSTKIFGHVQVRTRPPAWQGIAISIALCPSGHSHNKSII